MKFLADENFNSVIIRGLLLRNSTIDIKHVHRLGLSGSSDPNLLEWAFQNKRIILTHDRNTFPLYASQRIESGAHHSGVFVMNHQIPIRLAIEQLEMIAICSNSYEWIDLVIFLPF